MTIQASPSPKKTEPPVGDAEGMDNGGGGERKADETVIVFLFIIDDMLRYL
jgi:hypothetical protein